MGFLSSIFGGGGGKSGPQTTNQQVTASDAAQVFTGDNAKNIAAGASLTEVGTLTDNSKGVDLSNASLAQGSSVTIGETGLGNTFASTVRDLSQSQSEAFITALGALKPLPLIDQPPGAASATPGSASEWVGKIKTLAKQYWWALAITVAAIAWWLWWLWRRKR